MSRAVGATVLALTAALTLSGCADDGDERAFGGAGSIGDPPDLPTDLPSINPTGPGLTSGGSTGGSSLGSTGGTSGGSSGPSANVPSAPPTYNRNATGEVIGENCRYSRSSSRMSFDVDIQNSSSDHAFRYTFNVVFKVGKYANSTVASQTISTQHKTVTVSAGGDRTITVHTSHSTNERLVYSCQVSSAYKYLSS